MSWTYDIQDLATNEVYQVRLEIGDTDPEDPLLEDEEISQAISLEKNFWAAAARCCEMAAKQFLRKADPRLGRSLYIVYSKGAQQWQEMAAAFRKRATGTQVPFVGGMFVVDKNAYQQDQAFLQPIFTKRMMEDPWVGGYTSDTAFPREGPEPSI